MCSFCYESWIMKHLRILSYLWRASDIPVRINWNSMEMNNSERGGSKHGRKIQNKELPDIKARVFFENIELITTEKSQGFFGSIKMEKKWKKITISGGNNFSQPYIFKIKCQQHVDSNQLLIKIIWIKQNISFQQLKKISSEILKYILHALKFYLENEIFHR